ncbi:MAG: hypothetical protein HC897_09015 [Thermoanaerobaculia bacterium]|nr:hypothetical protein [Thermoanaerobaculia bacterium]
MRPSFVRVLSVFAGVVLPLAAPGQGTVIIDSRGTNFSGEGFSASLWYGEEFRTDETNRTLTELATTFAGIHPSDFDVSIWSNDPGNNVPDTELVSYSEYAPTFDQDSDIVQRDFVIDKPILLEANTTYWVVMRVTAGSTGSGAQRHNRCRVWGRCPSTIMWQRTAMAPGRADRRGSASFGSRCVLWERGCGPGRADGASRSRRGSTATISGTFVNDDPTESVTLTIDWGDGLEEVFVLNPGATSFGPYQHTYSDGPSNAGGKVTIEDVVSSDELSFDIEVLNVAPTAAIGGPYVTLMGQSIGLDASASSDPGVDDTLTF